MCSPSIRDTAGVMNCLFCYLTSLTISFLPIVLGLTGGLTCFYLALGLRIVGEEGGDLFLSVVGFYFISFKLIGVGGSIVFYLMALINVEF